MYETCSFLLCSSQIYTTFPNPSNTQQVTHSGDGVMFAQRCHKGSPDCFAYVKTLRHHHILQLLEYCLSLKDSWKEHSEKAASSVYKTFAGTNRVKDDKIIK